MLMENVFAAVSNTKPRLTPRPLTFAIVPIAKCSPAQRSELQFSLPASFAS